jgi:DMSO reductase family type II enzyme chaperone
MPTPSEPAPAGEWAARTRAPKRSVFGNYRADAAPPSGDPGTEDSRRGEAPGAQPPQGGTPNRLQTAIDLAMARSFIHRYLAKAYEDPTPESWRWLCNAGTQASLRAAWTTVAAGPLPPATFSPDAFPSFLNACLAAFGHAARGSCPLNEIEYGDIKADPLFQPHRLADLAAFYRAFGLEVATDAGERHDHICLELEFMCVLAAKEAYALEHQFEADELALCRDAQRKFLREHLGRWTPAFARRLAAATREPALRALAGLTRAFVESECARFGVPPGSEELLLRPVNEAADRMCDSCGIANLPPGARAAT